MSTLVNNIAKGKRKALTSSYEDEKQRVLACGKIYPVFYQRRRHPNGQFCPSERADRAGKSL